MNKLLIAAGALVVGAAPLAASAAPLPHMLGPAAPRFVGPHHFYGGGVPVGAGLFGLALGAVIADAQPAYVAYPPYPVRCDWQTRAFPGPYGTVTYQQVQICR